MVRTIGPSVNLIVLTIDEKDGGWTDEILRFKQARILPEDKAAARRIRRAEPLYCIVDGCLYRQGSASLAQQAAVGGADVSIAPAHELSSDGLHVTDTAVGARRRRSAVRKRKRIDCFIVTVDFSKRSVVGVEWEWGKGEERRETIYRLHCGKRRRGEERSQVLISHGPLSCFSGVDRHMRR
ncbi:hypothetical protein BHM03_00044459 [Ensete ventricosum]|nr:hypothetical protein BHM03_00044459 [Ensete ventricosum]